MEYIWNCTGRCNAYCAFCWDRFKEEQELNEQEAVRLLDRIADSKCDMLLFTGGEPLVREDIFRLMAHAGKRGIDNLKLCTNGLLVGSLIEPIVKAMLTEIHISLNSTSLRETGSQSRLLEGIDLLSARRDADRTKLVLVSVLDPSHYEDFEIVLRYAQTRGVKATYQFFVETPQGAGADNTQVGTTGQEYGPCIIWLEEMHRQYPQTFDFYARFYLLAAKEYFLCDTIPAQCGAGTSFTVISPNGTTRPCYNCAYRHESIRDCFTSSCLVWWRGTKRAANIARLML